MVCALQHSRLGVGLEKFKVHSAKVERVLIMEAVVSLREWKENLLLLRDLEDVEQIYSTLKRLVSLSLDIQNRLGVQTTKVKVHPPPFISFQERDYW